MMHDDEADHIWFLAHWSGRQDFGVGVWICQCSAVKRVIYDPGDVDIVDPKNLQGPYIMREQEHVGQWTGE